MDYTSVMVIDEHLLEAEGIKAVLKAKLKPHLIKYFNVIDEAKKELCRQTYKHVFVGVKMRGKIGSEFIGELRGLFPELVIIIFCADITSNIINSLISSGANGIISKNESINETYLAIKKITQGELYLSTSLVLSFENKREKTGNVKISKRENDVMRCVANGKSIFETAEILQLSCSTVVTHRKNIMGKLNFKSATEIVSYAYKNQLY